eukprot:COSAG01_NODE_1617_length_9718_cov_267.124545_1_plen_58_part_00
MGQDDTAQRAQREALLQHATDEDPTLLMLLYTPYYKYYHYFIIITLGINVTFLSRLY